MIVLLNTAFYLAIVEHFIRVFYPTLNKLVEKKILKINENKPGKSPSALTFQSFDLTRIRHIPSS